MPLEFELQTGPHSINPKKGFGNVMNKTITQEHQGVSFVLAESVERMKEQISKLDLENAELRKKTLKLDKRNRILKENVVSLLQEKERLQDLEKTVEVLNNTITFLQRKISENETEISGLKKKHSNEKLGNMVNAKLSATNIDNCKMFLNPHLLARQVELLSVKNLELRTELERRAKISDKVKIDYDVALRDRTELMMEIRYLKSRVDDMKCRLDKSVNYFLRKNKLPKPSADVAKYMCAQAAENALRNKREVNLSPRNRGGSNTCIKVNSLNALFPMSGKLTSSSKKAPSENGNTSPVAHLKDDWNRDVPLGQKDSHEKGINSYVADIRSKIENECKQCPNDTVFTSDILEAIIENSP